MPATLTDAPSPSEAPARWRPFETLEDNPSYRRFYMGHGISLMGTWLQASAIHWIVFDLTRSEAWLGVVETANLLPGLAVGLFAGALADRVAPRSMVLATQVAQMLMAFALASLFLAGLESIWPMILILALARVGIAFEMPSRQVFLYEIVGREQLGNAIALNVGLFNASRVLGPALLGVCLATLGRASPFLINGLTYFAAIAAVLSIRGRAEPRPARRRGWRDALGGLIHLKDEPRIARLFALMSFFGIFGMGYNAMLSAYARESIGTGANGYSALMVAAGVGAILAAITVAALGRRMPMRRLIILGMFVFALAIAGAGTLPGALGDTPPDGFRMAAAMLCLLGAGFGSILFYSSLQTLIQLSVPDELRGRIMGVWMIVFSGSVPLGALLTGNLAQRFGVEPILVLSALICSAGAGAISVSGILKRRREEAAEASPTEGPEPVPEPQNAP